MMAINIPGETKRVRELVSHMVESYFTHGPSNVTSMQIVICNNKSHFKLKNLLTLVNTQIFYLCF